eukprot:gene2753-5421_t
MSYLIKKCLNVDELYALREECDSTTTNTPLHELSCAIDLFESSNLHDCHPARTVANEYFAERWRKCPPLFEQKSVIKHLLLHKFPKIIKKLYGYERIYLFNEHYVVKEPNSTYEFSWHTDSQEQLMPCQGPLTEYISIWCALDDVDENNGTIALPCNSTITTLPSIEVEHSTQDTSDNTPFLSSNSINTPNKIQQPAAPTAIETQPSSSDLGHPLTIEAGGCFTFASTVWHRSGPNTSNRSRRVFYAQYSPSIITSFSTSIPVDNSSNEQNASNSPISPLCFGIYCDIIITNENESMTQTCSDEDSTYFNSKDDDDHSSKRVCFR